ncbi:caspase family protein [Capilliphycus salinus ALCB114379]|uniref:nSTAND1 domain-containing NTPase n=1 Tax=Capilliphycus salinus TaxID=2768948 RepID=UPI0039A5A42D
MQLHKELVLVSTPNSGENLKMSEIKRSFAVLIGINQYINGIPALQTAVNDTQQLAKLLTEKYQYQVLSLLDRDATLSKLDNLLTAFTDKILPFSNGNQIKIEPDDRILFYFAGHGIALDGLENADGPVGFLIPQDGQRDQSETWLSMQRLHDSLIQLPCRHSLIILDCCFAGTFRWAATHREAVRSQTVYRERYTRYTSGCAQQVITSAAHDEKATDSLYQFGKRSESSDHSPFAELLFKGLNGEADLMKDGIITATELYVYLQSELGKTAAKQTPGFAQLRHHDKGEYIFIIPGFDVNQLPSAPQLNEKNNPYKGLESFEEGDSDKFFGRQALTEKLVEFVSKNPLTVVLGASGTGKSSLVKAGLISQLKTTRDNWMILPAIRPGESPFRALNYALQRNNFSPQSERFIQPINSKVSNCENKFNSDFPNSEIQNTQNLLTDLNEWKKEFPDEKILLVIDQFEEIVTLNSDSEEQKMFLNGLTKALERFSDWLRIVVTLRSDFEPQFRETALEQYWTKSRFVVPAMTREELRQIIVEPATTKVMYFEPPTLIEQLIDEVVQMPGALPLLSFTLSELYFNYIQKVREGTRNNRAITQEDYQELGGVTRSLTQRADWEYAALIKRDPAYEKTIRHLMLRMVAVGGGELARRRVLEEELVYPEPENQRIQETIERFCAARLLVKGRDTEGKSYVEPAHDVLVRGWQKLILWEREHQEDLILQRRLTSAALEWKTKEKSLSVQDRFEPMVKGLDRSFIFLEGLFDRMNTSLFKFWKKTSNLQKHPKEKPEEFLWDSNPYLKVLEDNIKSNETWFNQVEAEFLQRSLRRWRNNRRTKISLIVTAFAVLSGFGLFQWNQNQQAQSRNLALSAEQLFNSEQELDALIEALKAYKTMKGAIFADANTQKEVLTALQGVMYQIRENNRLIGHTNEVYNINYSPDGQIIASASGDDTIKLWKKDGTLLHTLSGHTNDIVNHHFSPNGQFIASASRDGTIKLWNKDGTLLNTLTDHQAIVNHVTFSPNGEMIASASDDGTIKLWKKDGILLKTIEDNGPISSVSFSPDGQTIASGSMDGTVKLWKKDGTFLKSFSAHNGLVINVNFSPDGEMIGSSSSDKTVKLWKPDGTFIRTLEHNAQALKVNFSADSQMIVSSSADNLVKIWKRDGTLLKTLTGRSVNLSPDGQTLAFARLDHSLELWKWNTSLRQTFIGPTDIILGLSFSPNGEALVSASPDKKAQLWKANGRLLTTFSGHQDIVFGINFSSDGQKIVSGSWDNTVKLWKIDGTLLNTFSGHKASVYAVSFSPDNQMIVSGSNDTTVKLWKIDGTLLNTLSGHNAGISGISWNSAQEIFATSSIDGTVKLWKIDGTLLNTFSEHNTSVYNVDFHPDGQTLTSASASGAIKVWEPDGSLINSWTGHNLAVNSVRFSPDGSAIASGSDDQTVKFWKPDGTWLATLPGHLGAVRSLSFSPDNKTLASGGDDQTIILWNLEGLEIEGLLKHSCDWLEDYFNNPNVSLIKEDRRVCDGI